MKKTMTMKQLFFFLIGHLVRLVDIILMADSILAVLPIQAMTDQDDKAFMYLMFTAYWIRENSLALSYCKYS